MGVYGVLGVVFASLLITACGGGGSNGGGGSSIASSSQQAQESSVVVSSSSSSQQSVPASSEAQSSSSQSVVSSAGESSSLISLVSSSSSIQSSASSEILVISSASSTLSASSESSESSSSSVSSSDSSSSSSSSLVAVGPCDQPGEVFIDHVCDTWLEVSAFEMLMASPWTNHEISDNEEAIVVNFQIVDAEESEHQKVVDIHYKDEPDYYGVVRMRSAVPEGTDMEAYKFGKIQFDLKIIDAGTASPDLQFVIECWWPCGNTPKLIKPQVIGEWQTVEFSVADLIDSGLNINQVNMGFMLYPAWGEQAGVHFQVDNIRWVAGIEVEPTEEVCFANYLDTPWIQNVSGVMFYIRQLDFSSGGEAVATVRSQPYAEVTPTWSLVKGRWTMDFTEPLSLHPDTYMQPLNPRLDECSSKGTLSADVYVDQSLVDDGTIDIKFAFVDSGSGVYEIGEAIDVSSLNPNEWNKISVNLSDATQQSNLRSVGIVIDSTFVDDELEGNIAVDNFVIKAPLEEE